MNYYASVDDVFNNIDEGKLLVGNNAEWAKEAVVSANHVDLDYYIGVGEIDKLLEQCEKKLDHYRRTGSVAQVECYCDFMNMLRSLWDDPEKY